MKKKSNIKWKVIKVAIGKIKPTPNNYKIKTEQGEEMLQTSHDKFGRAGVIIVNLDMTIINGNSNWIKAKERGEKIVEVSIPSRQLNKKEFEEFSAMFDAIRAGEVDMLRIKKEKGTTKDFFKTWGLEELPGMLDNLAELEKAEGKVIATAKSTKQVEVAPTKPVTLLFTAAENKIFLDKVELLNKKYRTDNVTDLVFKVFTKKGLLCLIVGLSFIACNQPKPIIKEITPTYICPVDSSLYYIGYKEALRDLALLTLEYKIRGERQTYGQMFDTLYIRRGIH